MTNSPLKWKKGRGTLGILEPLLGTWLAESDSPMGRVICTRRFQWVLNGKYMQLHAMWNFAERSYEELAIYGRGNANEIVFWSFTSDGKKSEGKIADGTDVHPEALCFEAWMPAGLARMIYWPSSKGGINWVVESKIKNGWRRFAEHYYRAI